MTKYAKFTGASPSTSGTQSMQTALGSLGDSFGIGYEQRLAEEARADKLAQQDILNQRAVRQEDRLLDKVARDTGRQAQQDYTLGVLAEANRMPLADREQFLADKQKEEGGFLLTPATYAAQEKLLAQPKAEKYAGNYYSKKLADGSIQKVQAKTPEQAKQLESQGFGLGTLTAPKGGKTTTTNGKTATAISKIIGGLGNSEDVEQAWVKAKAKGLSDKDFLDYLYTVGGGDLSDKDWDDFGKKTLKLDALNAALEKLEVSGTDSKVTETAKKEILGNGGTTDKVKVMSAGKAAKIEQEIADLKAGSLFSAGKTSSGVKQLIDAEYGEGTYDKYK